MAPDSRGIYDTSQEGPELEAKDGTVTRLKGTTLLYTVEPHMSKLDRRLALWNNTLIVNGGDAESHLMHT